MPDPQSCEVSAVQKLRCILLAPAMATAVAGCATTEPEGTPGTLVNGQQFYCMEQELESKVLVRCVRP